MEDVMNKLSKIEVPQLKADAALPHATENDGVVHIFCALIWGGVVLATIF